MAFWCLGGLGLFFTCLVGLRIQFWVECEHLGNFEFFKTACQPLNVFEKFLSVVYFTIGFEADTQFFPALKHPILKIYSNKLSLYWSDLGVIW